MSTTTILGVFTTGEGAANAARGLRDAGLGSVATFTPTADHAVLGTHAHPTSPVRVFTLVGGLIGCAVGIALPVYTMLDWPLIVGGKPLISVPPLVIIGFELTMLGAALGGFIGFLLVSGLPQLWRGPSNDNRFTDDRFGVLVTCTEAERDAVCARLEDAEPERVEVEGARDA